jgi:hypothetical protein
MMADNLLPNAPPNAGKVAILRPVPNGEDHLGYASSADNVAAARRFAVADIDSLTIGSEPVWLINGILPAQGLGIVYGLPKCGKSFLLADTLFHVAMGRPWAERDVLQGAVVYVTGEGVSGFRRRMVAFRRHYGVDGLGVPFGIISVAPDLGHNTGDEQELIANIRNWLALKGNPPLRAVALDTVARTMNGADENTAKDMTTWYANANKIEQEFNCLVVGVHHSGKDATRGARGSNALDGAADVMWHVDKGEVASTVTVAAMKDGEDGASWTYRLQPYYFDEAREGGATSAQQVSLSTCTVEILTNPSFAQQTATRRNKKALRGKAARLMDIICKAIGEAGESVKGNQNVPPDVRAISRDMLNKYVQIKGFYEEGKPPNYNRAVLSRHLNALAGDRYIGLTDAHLWVV